MSNCPMNGKPCQAVKVFSIAETVGEFTYSTQCCRSCATDYVEFRNKAAVKEVVSNNPISNTNAVNLLSQILGVDLSKVANGKPLIIQKCNAGDLVELSDAPASAEKRCPGCKSSLEDIRKAKRIGCKQCFSAFEAEISEFMPKIQAGQTEHKGKKPSKSPEVVLPANSDSLVKILQEQMEAAVAAEDYDKAAQCRDLIKKYGGTVTDDVSDNQGK